jgi:hypothetical protein
MKKNNVYYSLPQNREKIIADLQDFLNHKRANSIDYGTRLLEPFTVVGFTHSDDSLMAQFEGHEKLPQSNHYWVGKSELEQFLLGIKTTGVNLIVDNLYTENSCIVMDVNLMKNGFKKMTIYDAQKLKGIQINHDRKIYKSYDVQVQLSKDINIDKLVKVFVLEPSSAEAYINKHTVVQNNKIQLQNGITFEDANSKETYVKKSDALEAVRMERKTVSDELRAWFILNMANKVEAPFSDAFLKKLKEIV